MSAFMAVLRRDLLLALRRKAEVLTGVFFFVVVASLFPLAIGPEMATLRKVAPGVIWVGALLASMLSLGRLFESDHRDGTLEHMALSPAGLAWLVAAKILAHWLTSGLPLVLLAPLLGLQFDLPAESLGVLMLTLLIGTPAPSRVTNLELYLIFPLTSEESTVTLVRGTMATGGLVLLVLGNISMIFSILDWY